MIRGKLLRLPTDVHFQEKAPRTHPYPWEDTEYSHDQQRGRAMGLRTVPLESLQTCPEWNLCEPTGARICRQNNSVRLAITILLSLKNINKFSFYRLEIRSSK